MIRRDEKNIGLFGHIRFSPISTVPNNPVKPRIRLRPMPRRVSQSVLNKPEFAWSPPLPRQQVQDHELSQMAATT